MATLVRFVIAEKCTDENSSDNGRVWIHPVFYDTMTDVIEAVIRRAMDESELSEFELQMQLSKDPIIPPDGRLEIEFDFVNLIFYIAQIEGEIETIPIIIGKS